MTATSSPRPSPRPRRKRSRPERFAPLAAAALIAFGVGGYVGAKHEPAAAGVARQWAAAWERGDYAEMHGLLSDSARKRTSLKRFVRTYRQAERDDHAAASSASPSRSRARTAPTTCRSRCRRGSSAAWRGTVRLPMVDKEDGKAVDWRAELVFPGLRRGEKLTRETTLGDARRHPRARRHAAGQGPRPPVGPRPAGRRGRRPRRPGAARARRRARAARRARGRAGRAHRARARVRRAAGRDAPAASCAPASAWSRARRRSDGVDVRTAIDPDIQRAAVEALAGRFGGIAVLRPATGEVLGLSGIAFSAPQPPGSTFKIITLAAALEARKVRPRSSFPVQTETTLEGVKLQNAHGEACGGSLKSSFAESCNSVFAPLGAKVGAQPPRRDRRALRLQPGPRPGRRGPLDDPRAGRDRRRPRGRLVGDRPGQGARHAARARHRGGHHRPARPPRRAGALARRPGQGDARGQHAHRGA